eukprot:scaffold60537_cov55-Cyclotella_meneghiniana.AAC.1
MDGITNKVILRIPRTNKDTNLINCTIAGGVQVAHQEGNVIFREVIWGQFAQNWKDSYDNAHRMKKITALINAFINLDYKFIEYDEVTNDQLCANKSVYAEAVVKELRAHFEHQKDSSKELEIDEDLERLEDKVRGTNCGR